MEFGILFAPHLGVKSTAAAAARGEKVDDDELVAGVGQGIDKVLGGLDLTHVGLQPLLPPPHGFPNRKVHVHLSNRTNKNQIILVKILTFSFLFLNKSSRIKDFIFGWSNGLETTKSKPKEKNIKIDFRKV